MSKYNNGGRAFPTPRDEYNEGNTGMSIRAYFAGQAMQGMLSNPRLTGTYEDTACAVVVDADFTAIQRLAVKHADALIEELNR